MMTCNDILPKKKWNNKSWLNVRCLYKRGRSYIRLCLEKKNSLRIFYTCLSSQWDILYRVSHYSLTKQSCQGMWKRYQQSFHSLSFDYNIMNIESLPQRRLLIANQTVNVY